MLADWTIQGWLRASGPAYSRVYATEVCREIVTTLKELGLGQVMVEQTRWYPASGCQHPQHGGDLEGSTRTVAGSHFDALAMEAAATGRRPAGYLAPRGW